MDSVRNRVDVDVDWERRRFYPLSEPTMRIHDDRDGLEFLIYDGDAESAEQRGERARQKFKFEWYYPSDTLSLMALCNIALAEGSVVTWEDIDVLRRASVTVRMGDMETMQDDTATARVQTIATRLAALLPPREPVHP